MRRIKESVSLILLVASPFQRAQVVPAHVAPKYDMAWTSEAWTADEAPYVRVRKEVEAYVRGRKVSDKRTDLYGRTERMLVSWKANPKDPVILYRAAYYAYMLSGLEYTDEAKKLLREEHGYAAWMRTIPSPHSREYDRLRMLIEGFLNGAFVDLGERLYKFDPADREIAMKLAWVHSRFGPASRKRGLEIAERLLKTEDLKLCPAVHYSYGLAHSVSYTEEPTEKHAQQALWAYRQYLAAGPPWRKRAIEVKKIVEDFEKYLADKKPKP